MGTGLRQLPESWKRGGITAENNMNGVSAAAHAVLDGFPGEADPFYPLYKITTSHII